MTELESLAMEIADEIAVDWIDGCQHVDGWIRLNLRARQQPKTAKYLTYLTLRGPNRH